jgi:hypothetical protein
MVFSELAVAALEDFTELAITSWILCDVPESMPQI